MQSGNYVDSSGTDDDLPPSYQNRSMKGGGRMSGNGRDVIRVDPYARAQPQTDMETRIHQLEQEAYCFVLRAFKAQSDAITWEKEGLITELRKELRVSDKEHRELLNRVNNDDIIRSIREWRESTGGLQMNLVNNNVQHSHDPMPSPTTSARKRQKTSQPIHSASIPAPSALHPQPLTGPLQASSSGTKKAAPSGTKGKKTKPGQKTPNVPTVKAMPSSAGLGGRELNSKINPPGCLPSERLTNPLIGRKVMTRWPDDNSFYEAVITEYNAAEDRYALVYDMGTAHESFEWVDFKEMDPEDVKWEDGDPGINLHGHGVPVRGGKKSNQHIGGPVSGAGRGRGPQKNSFKKEHPPSQNGVGKKSSDRIEILHTDFLIKEVERVFSTGHPDPVEMERAKKVLKEHEQSLIDAIARLAEASDGESDDRARSLEYSRGWQNQHGRRYADDMVMDGFLTGDADAM